MQVTTGNHYLAFVLDEDSRTYLRRYHTNQDQDFVCHHVTIAYEITPELIPRLQALVDARPTMRINMKASWDSHTVLIVTIELIPHQPTIRRITPEGGVNHITLVMLPGESARYSNELLGPTSASMPTAYEMIDRYTLTGSFQLIPKGPAKSQQLGNPLV